MRTLALTQEWARTHVRARHWATLALRARVLGITIDATVRECVQGRSAVLGVGRAIDRRLVPDGILLLRMSYERAADVSTHAEPLPPPSPGIPACPVAQRVVLSRTHSAVSHRSSRAAGGLFRVDCVARCVPRAARQARQVRRSAAASAAATTRRPALALRVKGAQDAIRLPHRRLRTLRCSPM